MTLFYFFFLVPQLIANLTMNGILNHTTLNLTIFNIHSSMLCGNKKYLLITAISLDKKKYTTDELKNISLLMANTEKGGRFSNSWDYSKFYSNITYNFDFNKTATIPCDDHTRDNYTKQSKVVNITIGEFYYYTNYSVMVHLCNEIGCGDPSPPQQFRTDEYIPFCHPDDISFWNTSSISLKLAWSNDTKKCFNGEFGYLIYIKRIRNGNVVQNKTTQSEIEYQDLGKYELYCIGLAVYTKVGVGPFTEPLCKYTDEDCKF